MEAYAIISTGGKQYMVSKGSVLQVESLESEPGQKIDITGVLAKSDGQLLQIGAPELANAKVSCSVLRHIRGPKVVSFKKKRRKGYTRKKGHRQELTVLKVEAV